MTGSQEQARPPMTQAVKDWMTIRSAIEWVGRSWEHKEEIRAALERMKPPEYSALLAWFQNRQRSRRSNKGSRG